MKKYFHCVLIFIAIYIIVTLLTNFAMKNEQKDLKYSVNKDDRFEISVEDAKTSNSNGYINLKISNKSDKLIENIYLKLELYNDNSYIITKYKPIKYLNIGETNKFDINFNDANVNKVNISVVEDMPVVAQENNIIKKVSKSDLSVNPEITDEAIKLALPIAVALGLMIIIP